MAGILFDLRHAARAIARQPLFAAGVALTLALGLGLNAMVLGMMDALLFRPFQFADAGRLIVAFETPHGGSAREPVAPATFLEWRRQMRSVEGLIAWEGWGATLGSGTDPERLQTFRVSPAFFDTLGIRPVLGRTFSSTDDQPGRERIVVIGQALWARRFGANPGIVGTSVLLDGAPHTVIGVAPAGFDFPVGAESWTPLALTGEQRLDRRHRSLTVLGKLAAGRSLDEAGEELQLIGLRLATEYPDTHGDRGTLVRSLSTAFREDASGGLVAVLQAAAALVLLVACGNLAGLLLARATDRQREVAVRSAIGASRARIVRQLVVEIVLLALVASVIAIICARLGLDVLRSSIPADMARYIEGWNNVRLDWRLIPAIPAFAILVGLGVGVIPALSATSGSLAGALKEGDRSGSGGVRRQRARQALVVAEIAFALSLLAAAGLAIDGGARMIAAPGGFDSRSLLTVNVPLPESRYADAARRRTFADTLETRLESIAAVRHAALANVLPAAGWSPTQPLVVEGAPVQDAAHRPTAGFRAVSAGFFETMGIPIVRGRAFSSADREDAQPVAIVSASLAARFWPGGDAVGRRVQLGDATERWLTIIGVAGSVTMYNWWDGINLDAVYVPLGQSTPAGSLSVALRTRGEPSSLSSATRAAVASVDPLLAIDNMRTMEQAIAASTFGLNMIAYLLGICGTLALLLAIVGIYSLMAFAVSQRRHEFGVRMALGASGRDVLRLSLRQAGVLTAAGVSAGFGLAAVLGRLMSSALFGVVRLDAGTLVQVSATLGVVALAAAFIPAWQSAKLDPARVLRGQ
jgi:putative ABC transport system permease protein